MADLPRLVFKVLRDEEMTVFERVGVFYGSAHDLRDGFIHLAEGHQVMGVLDRHFPGERDLWLIALPTLTLIEDLVWESSAKGERFPHLYAPMVRGLVRGLWPIGEDAAGRPLLPPAAER